MDEELRRAIQDSLRDEAFAQKMGFRVTRLEPGEAEVEMVPGTEDANLFGVVHGGAIFSLMDEAFQASCNSHGSVALALSVNVVYHNPARFGKRLVAVSREIHRTRKTGTYEIRVKDEEGVLIASAQALAYRKREPLPCLRQREGG